MMLVISVIVAVAILGILLGFLGGITTFGANAGTVIPELVKKVAQKGYGLEIREKVEFTPGDRFYQLTAIGEAPIPETDISFVCQDKDGICGSSDTTPLTVSDKSIVVNKKITGTIAVCVGSDLKYKVVIGKVTKDVSKEAESECKLA